MDFVSAVVDLVSLLCNPEYMNKKKRKKLMKKSMLKSMKESIKGSPKI